MKKTSVKARPVTGKTVEAVQLEQKTIDRALVYINAALTANNFTPLKKLPKGLPHDGRECPIAKALASLDATVGADVIRFKDAETGKKVADAWTALPGAASTVSGTADLRTLRMPRPLWHLRRGIDLGRAPQFVSKAAANRKAPGRAIREQ